MSDAVDRRRRIKPRGRIELRHTRALRGVTDEKALFSIPTRQAKPRTIGLTEVRGPYYTALGKRYLEDLFETMGEHIDSLKFAGGAFTLMPPPALRDIIRLAHSYRVRVSTGGFIEYVVTRGPAAVRDYLKACQVAGFDVIEISAGFISIPMADYIRLIKEVTGAGLNAKAEIGIQFGAGGASRPEALEEQGTQSVKWAIERARRSLDAGAFQIMLESEGVTENVRTWRTDVPAKFATALGLEKIMFEAADPEVFSWYVKNFGPDVDLFIDHSQIVQLEALRRGIWGMAEMWGRVARFAG